MNRGSFHTRSFRLVHFSVFRYRHEPKMALWARKVSGAFEKLAPGSGSGFRISLFPYARHDSESSEASSFKKTKVYIWKGGDINTRTIKDYVTRASLFQNKTLKTTLTQCPERQRNKMGNAMLETTENVRLSRLKREPRGWTNWNSLKLSPFLTIETCRITFLVAWVLSGIISLVAWVSWDYLSCSLSIMGLPFLQFGYYRITFLVAWVLRDYLSCSLIIEVFTRLSSLISWSSSKAVISFYMKEVP